ncbi:hypothetical protein CBL_00001 [Carabus blaptoides fortunei]
MLEYLVENIADECPDMKFVSIKLAEGPRGGNIQIDALGSTILFRRTYLQEHVVRCTFDKGYELHATNDLQVITINLNADRRTYACKQCDNWNVVVHEYMLSFTYPVMFVQFFGLGMAFSFVKYNSAVGNIFLWTTLTTGTGLPVCTTLVVTSWTHHLSFIVRLCE